MSGSSKRLCRVQDLIYREVASLISRGEICDPRLQGMSIISVDVSPDLKQAKIFYIIPGVENALEVAAVLEKTAGFIRTQLSKRAVLRHAPKIKFVFDEHTIRAKRISELIDQVVSPDVAQDIQKDIL